MSQTGNYKKDLGIKDFNWKILSGSFYDEGFWLRLWNCHGLEFRNAKYPRFFCERMGIVKPFKIFGWRINRLKP